MAADRPRDSSVGELASPVRNALVGGPFGSDLVTADYVTKGVPVIRGQNLSIGKFVGGDFVYVSEAKADQLKANLARPGDLVFTQRGNAVLQGGQVAIVPASPFGRYLVSQSQMKLTVDTTKADPTFLYSVFTSPDYAHYLRSNAIATGVPHINLSILRQYRLALPPLSQQKAIAHILGTLDDKIELNRRMNQTLEAIAQALFKEWFIDPSKEDLPNGWKVSTLGDLSAYLSRGLGPSYVETQGVLVLNQKCVRNHRIDFSQARRHDTKKRSIAGRTLRKYDILVNSTGTGTLGRVAQVLRLPEEAIVDSHVTVVRASDSVDACFLGMATLLREPEIAALGEGSTGQTELSRTRLASLPVLAPPPDMQRTYGAAVQPLFEHIALNEQSSRTLAQLRDALLPKLLSGELRIKDADKFLEART